MRRTISRLGAISGLDFRQQAVLFKARVDWRYAAGKVRVRSTLVPCLTNKFNDLLVFFAPGRVAPPRVGPTTTRRHALPETKNPAHFIKLICETGH